MPTINEQKLNSFFNSMKENGHIAPEITYDTYRTAFNDSTFRSTLAGELGTSMKELEDTFGYVPDAPTLKKRSDEASSAKQASYDAMPILQRIGAAFALPLIDKEVKGADYAKHLAGEVVKGAASDITGMITGVKALALSAPRGFNALADFQTDETGNVSDRLYEESRNKAIRRALKEKKSMDEAVAKAIDWGSGSAIPRTVLSDAAQGVGSTLGFILPGAVAGKMAAGMGARGAEMMASGLTGALAEAGSQTEEIYDAVLEKTGDEDEALRIAKLSLVPALAIGATEALPMGSTMKKLGDAGSIVSKFIRSAAGKKIAEEAVGKTEREVAGGFIKGLARHMAKEMAEEGAQEAFQTELEQRLGQIAYDKEYKFGETVYAGALGAVSAGFLGGLGHASSTGLSAAYKKHLETKVERVNGVLAMNKVEDVAQGADATETEHLVSDTYGMATPLIAQNDSFGKKVSKAVNAGYTTIIEKAKKLSSGDILETGFIAGTLNREETNKAFARHAGLRVENNVEDAAENAKTVAQVIHAATDPVIASELGESVNKQEEMDYIHARLLKMDTLAPKIESTERRKELNEIAERVRPLYFEQMKSELKRLDANTQDLKKILTFAKPDTEIHDLGTLAPSERTTRIASMSMDELSAAVRSPKNTAHRTEIMDEAYRRLEKTRSDESENMAFSPDFVGQEANTTTGKGYINHSGGAIGSDAHWGHIGLKFGVTSNHYYFGRKTPLGNVAITEAEYEDGVEKVREANAVFKRNIDDRFLPLLARNWQQVKHADAVFAVGRIIGIGESNSKGYANKAGKEIVDGGTGWAVEMAIQAGKPVYVFDQEKKAWYKWEGVSFKKIAPPRLTKNFAGIGTRELNEDGKRAIETTYERTFQVLEKDDTAFDERKELERLAFWNDGKEHSYHAEDSGLASWKAIRELAKRSGFRVTYRFVDTLKGRDGKVYAAGYNTQTGEIVFARDQVKTHEQFRDAILEELIHHATIDRLHIDPVFHAAAETLRLEFLAHVGMLNAEQTTRAAKLGIKVQSPLTLSEAEKRSVLYYTSNTAEFLAGVFASKEFRDVARRIQTGGLRAASSEQSMFGKIVDALARLFKLEHRTMMDEIAALLDRKDALSMLHTYSPDSVMYKQAEHFNELYKNWAEAGSNKEQIFASLVAHPALAEYAQVKYASLIKGDPDLFRLAQHLERETRLTAPRSAKTALQSAVEAANLAEKNENAVEQTPIRFEDYRDMESTDIEGGERYFISPKTVAEALGMKGGSPFEYIQKNFPTHEAFEAAVMASPEMQSALDNYVRDHKAVYPHRDEASIRRFRITKLYMQQMSTRSYQKAGIILDPKGKALARNPSHKSMMLSETWEHPITQELGGSQDNIMPLVDYLPALESILGLEPGTLDIGQVAYLLSVNEKTGALSEVDVKSDNFSITVLSDELQKLGMIPLGKFADKETIPFLRVAVHDPENTLKKAMYERCQKIFAGYAERDLAKAGSKEKPKSMYRLGDYLRLMLDELKHGTPVDAFKEGGELLKQSVLLNSAKLDFVGSNKRAFLTGKGMRPVVTKEALKLARSGKYAGITVKNDRIYGRTMVLDTNHLSSAEIELDGERFTLRDLLNDNKISRLDGAGVYVLGQMNVIMDEMTGDLQGGTYKVYANTVPGGLPMFQKLAYHGIHADSKLARWMKQEGIAMLVADESEKLGTETSFGYVGMERTELGQSAKPYEIDFSDLRVLQQSKPIKDSGLGLRTLLATVNPVALSDFNDRTLSYMLDHLKKFDAYGIVREFSKWATSDGASLQQQSVGGILKQFAQSVYTKQMDALFREEKELRKKEEKAPEDKSRLSAIRMELSALSAAQEEHLERTLSALTPIFDHPMFAELVNDRLNQYVKDYFRMRTSGAQMKLEPDYGRLSDLRGFADDAIVETIWNDPQSAAYKEAFGDGVLAESLRTYYDARRHSSSIRDALALRELGAGERLELYEELRVSHQMEREAERAVKEEIARLRKEALSLSLSDREKMSAEAIVLTDKISANLVLTKQEREELDHLNEQIAPVEARLKELTEIVPENRTTAEQSEAARLTKELFDLKQKFVYRTRSSERAHISSPGSLINREGKAVKDYIDRKRKEIFTPDGHLKEGYGYVSEDFMKKFNVAPLDEAVYIVTPTDSPLACGVFQVIPIPKTHMTSAKIALNSEAIQGKGGRDFDIDKLFVVPKSSFFSNSDWETMKEHIKAAHEGTESFQKQMYGEMHKVFQTPEGKALLVKNGFTKDTFMQADMFDKKMRPIVSTAFMQHVFGVSSGASLPKHLLSNYAGMSAFTQRISDVASSERKYEMLAAMKIETSLYGNKIRYEVTPLVRAWRSWWKNHVVDFPKDESKLHYGSQDKDEMNLMVSSLYAGLDLAENENGSKSPNETAEYIQGYEHFLIGHLNALMKGSDEDSEGGMRYEDMMAHARRQKEILTLLAKGDMEALYDEWCMERNGGEESSEAREFFMNMKADLAHLTHPMLKAVMALDVSAIEHYKRGMNNYDVITSEQQTARMMVNRLGLSALYEEALEEYLRTSSNPFLVRTTDTEIEALLYKLPRIYGKRLIDAFYAEKKGKGLEAIEEGKTLKRNLENYVYLQRQAVAFMTIPMDRKLESGKFITGEMGDPLSARVHSAYFTQMIGRAVELTGLKDYREQLDEMLSDSGGYYDLTDDIQLYFAPKTGVMSVFYKDVLHSSVSTMPPELRVKLGVDGDYLKSVWMDASTRHRLLTSAPLNINTKTEVRMQQTGRFLKTALAQIGRMPLFKEDALRAQQVFYTSLLGTRFDDVISPHLVRNQTFGFGTREMGNLNSQTKNPSSAQTMRLIYENDIKMGSSTFSRHLLECLSSTIGERSVYDEAELRNVFATDMLGSEGDYLYQASTAPENLFTLIRDRSIMKPLVDDEDVKEVRALLASDTDAARNQVLEKIRGLYRLESLRGHFIENGESFLLELGMDLEALDLAENRQSALDEFNRRYLHVQPGDELFDQKMLLSQSAYAKDKNRFLLAWYEALYREEQGLAKKYDDREGLRGKTIEKLDSMWTLEGVAGKIESFTIEKDRVYAHANRLESNREQSRGSFDITGQIVDESMAAHSSTTLLAKRRNYLHIAMVAGREMLGSVNMTTKLASSAIETAQNAILAYTKSISGRPHQIEEAARLNTMASRMIERDSADGRSGFERLGLSFGVDGSGRIRVSRLGGETYSPLTSAEELERLTTDLGLRRDEAAAFHAALIYQELYSVRVHEWYESTIHYLDGQTYWHAQRGNYRDAQYIAGIRSRYAQQFEAVKANRWTYFPHVYGGEVNTDMLKKSLVLWEYKRLVAENAVASYKRSKQSLWTEANIKYANRGAGIFAGGTQTHFVDFGRKIAIGRLYKTITPEVHYQYVNEFMRNYQSDAMFVLSLQVKAQAELTGMSQRGKNALAKWIEMNTNHPAAQAKEIDARTLVKNDRVILERTIWKLVRDEGGAWKRVREASSIAGTVKSVTEEGFTFKRRLGDDFWQTRQSVHEFIGDAVKRAFTKTHNGIEIDRVRPFKEASSKMKALMDRLGVDYDKTAFISVQEGMLAIRMRMADLVASGEIDQLSRNQVFDLVQEQADLTQDYMERWASTMREVKKEITVGYSREDAQDAAQMYLDDMDAGFEDMVSLMMREKKQIEVYALSKKDAIGMLDAGILNAMLQERVSDMLETLSDETLSERLAHWKSLTDEERQAERNARRDWTADGMALQEYATALGTTAFRMTRFDALREILARARELDRIMQGELMTHTFEENPTVKVVRKTGVIEGFQRAARALDIEVNSWSDLSKLVGDAMMNPTGDEAKYLAYQSIIKGIRAYSAARTHLDLGGSLFGLASFVKNFTSAAWIIATQYGHRSVTEYSQWRKRYEKIIQSANSNSRGAELDKNVYAAYLAGLSSGTLSSLVETISQGDISTSVLAKDGGFFHQKAVLKRALKDAGSYGDYIRSQKELSEGYDALTEEEVSALGAEPSQDAVTEAIVKKNEVLLSKQLDAAFAWENAKRQSVTNLQDIVRSGDLKADLERYMASYDETSHKNLAENLGVTGKGTFLGIARPEFFGKNAANRAYWSFISDYASDISMSLFQMPERFVRMMSVLGHLDIAERLEITDPDRLSRIGQNALRRQALYDNLNRQLGGRTIAGKLGYKYAQYNVFQYQEFKRDLSDAMHMRREMGLKPFSSFDWFSTIYEDKENTGTAYVKHYNLQYALFRRWIVSTMAGAAQAAMRIIGAGVVISQFMPLVDKWYETLIETLIKSWNDWAYPESAKKQEQRRKAYIHKMAAVGAEEDVISMQMVQLERDAIFTLGWGYKYPIEQTIALINKKSNESMAELLFDPFNKNKHAALTGTAMSSRLDAYGRYIDTNPFWRRVLEGKDAKKPLTPEARAYKPSFNRMFSKVTGLSLINYEQ